MISQTSIAIVTKTIAIGAVKQGWVSLSLGLCLSLTLSIVVSIAKTMEAITITKMSSIAIVTEPSISIVSQTTIPVGAIKQGRVSLSIGLRLSFSLTLSIIVTIAKPMQTIPVSIMSEPSISVS